MKQETLEEVAERLVKETTLYGSQEATIGSSARSYFETELRCVLMGMNWQQGRSYSEEEVLPIVEYIQWVIRKVDRGDTPEEIVRLLLFNRDKIEQFKKK